MIRRISWPASLTANRVRFKYPVLLIQCERLFGLQMAVKVLGEVSNGEVARD